MSILQEIRTRALTLLHGALLVAGVVLGGLALHAPAQAASVALPGEVLIELESSALLPGLLARYPVVVIDQFGSRPIYRLKVDPAVDLEQVIEALDVEIGVRAAEPNFLHGSPEARRNSPWALGDPAAYTTQWAPQTLRLDQAHRFARGAGVRVAVLDSGVDVQHSALAGKLLPGFDFVDLDNDPSEVGDAKSAGFGHGTFVAGLVSLVAPDAQIMPLRVLDSDGVGNAWVLGQAMLYAVDPDGDPTTDDGAQVINLSLGSPERTHILDTIAKVVSCAAPDIDEPEEARNDPGYANDKLRCARTGGAVIAAAAGNSATDEVREYPAAEGAYGLMAIAASSADERLASFSNFGSWVHLAAPGEGISSSIPGGQYATWSGTSMAAPMVAGTAALLRSLDPLLVPDQVVERLRRSSAPLCGTAIRRIDALAVLSNQAPEALVCR